MVRISEEKSQQFRMAASSGNLRLVKSLSLDPEVDLNWNDLVFRSGPFSAACLNGHVDIVRYLLGFHDDQRSIDYNFPDPHLWTPFASACNYGHVDIAKLLMADLRVDVNRADKFDRSPIWILGYFGFHEIGKHLLACGREIDLLKRDRGKHKMTAAEIARERGKGEIATWLEAFERDPRRARAELTRELSGPIAGELFALVVYLSDGYFELQQNQSDFNQERRSKAQKFFSLATQLPMDLQMVLCNRVFGLVGSIVKKSDSEEGFRKFASGV